MAIGICNYFDLYECLKHTMEEIEYNYNCTFVIESSKMVENVNPLLPCCLLDFKTNNM